MTDRPEDDLSPSLGGERAAEEPAPEPEPEPQSAGPGGEAPDLEQIFAELGQGELGELFRHLGPLLGAPRGRTEQEVDELLAGFEPFTREVQDLMQDTIRIMEERLPPTLAAFEGMFSALGQVFEPLFEEPRDPTDGQG